MENNVYVIFTNELAMIILVVSVALSGLYL
jgi:hypothetical protein